MIDEKAEAGEDLLHNTLGDIKAVLFLAKIEAIIDKILS